MLEAAKDTAEEVVETVGPSEEEEAAPVSSIMTAGEVAAAVKAVIAEPEAEPEAQAEEVAEEPVGGGQATATAQNNTKKLLFAASVVGIAASGVLGKVLQQKKEVPVAPPPPQYTTVCLAEGAAKKAGMPALCFRMPKKIVFEFKNKKLNLDLPSLYFKKVF